ncbi:hypothetical protein NP233_g11447 [Leucocoprinus birnbaumii]|uniref:Uncharacterized protein n=1 Tax=Leucocoprinus birnbaumii TaxID=56174 RepID=A0AAD5VH52_9AGAR|nr:hypothetical protein NP233_g11447 [Leucocoprinus birnbaumii]
MHDADIIELSSEASSPPPEPVPPPKRHATRSKGKGKMKEPEVIELTDDSDLEIQILDAGPPKRGPKGLKTAFSKISQIKNRGKQKAIVDDNSDIDIASITAPVPRPEAGPSRTRDSLMSNRLKEHPPSSQASSVAGSSNVVPGDGNQLRVGSQVESDTGAEVTQVANADGVDFVDLNPFNPPLSPSPTASPARIVPRPSTIAIPGSSAQNLATTSTGMASNTPPPPVPLPPPPLLESPEESMSRYVAQVLEIVPDVEPEHCASLVADHQHLNEGTVERILHILFEDPNYPRVQKGNGGDKGKRKADGIWGGPE